jgi:hypothetical protein
LVSFFVAAAALHLLASIVVGGDDASKAKTERDKENKTMKKLSVVVAGTGQIRDIEIESGTTAGDILNQLNLRDYLLSKGPNDPFFAAAESVYDKVRTARKSSLPLKPKSEWRSCAHKRPG